MKLSYSWLQDFVDIKDQGIETLAKSLTDYAFEVEDYASTGLSLDSRVVLGEIRQIAKHPDAEKLQVTQTCIGYDTQGQEIIEQIVCGAKNIAVGQKIPVATIGAKVFSRQDASQFEIKKSKIRGVESHGMLCSPDELGLELSLVEQIKTKQGDGIYLFFDPNNQAIVNLADGYKLGTPIVEILNADADYVLEIGARSNRGDALSVYGMAREVAAISKTALKKHNLREEDFTYDTQVRSFIPVIQNQDDAMVFYTISVENVVIQDSPDWLRQRINSMGIKSINNIVDISNYVLLELGQPMHFYDREALKGTSLIVRRAVQGEPLLTLEDKEHELNEINLVIADASGPVSLAGVMGGKNSSIQTTTQNIVIEVAAFTPSSVRRSARQAGVESESKRRFERGVDPLGSKLALLRAMQLIRELASTTETKFSQIQVCGDISLESKLVTLKHKSVQRLLGIEIEKSIIVDLLKALEINLVEDKEEILVFEIPSFRRNDITREVDLIEEIVRLYGYDKIPAQAPKSSSALISELEERRRLDQRIHASMLAAGFSEAKLSSLIGDSLINLDKGLASLLVKAKTQDYIEMDNPLSREHSILRQSLLPSLLQAASRNYAYDKSIDVKLYEFAKIYFNTTGDVTQEIFKLAGIWTSVESNWAGALNADKFFVCKSIIENLYPRAEFLAIEEDQSLIHPGIAAQIKEDGRIIGFLAKIHPQLSDEWDLPEDTYIFELNLPKLPKIKFKAISTNPIIERDITVDSISELNSNQIKVLLQKYSSKDLQAIKLVSVYDRKTGDFPKSTSFRLKYQSETETLSGKAIDEEIIRIKSLLEKELGVKFRA